MQKLHTLKLIALCLALLTGVPTALRASDVVRPWMNKNLSPSERAELALKQMTFNEKLAMLHGNGMPHVPFWQMPLTYKGNGGAGYVEGVPRLGIPDIVISDAAYGVRSGSDNGRYATALPSNLAAASSWDAETACEYGTLIGRELRNQGFNMTLGGGVGITRDPRNGRTFEYAGEDPLLAGTVVGNLMKCEQAQHVLGDIKHYAMNDQETGRNIVNVKISKRAMQESDLLAFHVALDIAKPGAVMCAYNRVNDVFACQNSYLLRDVLKHDWGYRGFVVSDWGGTHSTAAAITAGLDQEQPMASYFGGKLREAVDQGRVPVSQIDDSARRILYAEFASGVVDTPERSGVPDIDEGLAVAQRVEEKSIVLLKNESSVLPLKAEKIRSIALIGGHADVAMISGGGSAQVDPPGGNAILPPGQGATHWQDQVWFPTSPLKALQTLLPNTRITFSDGRDATAAATAARDADVAIVFAYQWESEGLDLPNLSLPDGQDQLIERVASANAHVIVVLETGSAVTMPWLDKIQGVVEAWYAGSSGHKALANVLTGRVNPTAKLPMTFPKSEADLPRVRVPPLSSQDQGQGTAAVNGPTDIDSKYSIDYGEGAKVGYKWYEAENKAVLFPFGFGLSYTHYQYSGLKIDRKGDQIKVRFLIKNVGQRPGSEIAQIYVALPAAAGESYRRLAAWQRVDLQSDEQKLVDVTLDPRVLRIFDEHKNAWAQVKGVYRVVAGPSSADTPLHDAISLP